MTADRADPNLRGSLLGLVMAFTASQVIHVGTRLGIPDLLADGPKSSDELAKATGAEPSALYRLLRGLACLGVAEESEAGRFALTGFGAPLRADHPDSVRNATLFYCGTRTWENWGHLLDSVQTGKPVYQLHNRPGPFEGASEEFWTVFNVAMSEGTRQAASGVAGSYDFSRFRTVVDVGGGDGTLIGAILRANDGLRGMLFDRPAGIKEAPSRLAELGVADRCLVVAGDFFSSVPEGGDAYLLKSVIHDWDDGHATAILANCRQVMPSHGRLLVLEAILPPKIGPSPEMTGAVLAGDLNMLVSTGGRERTEAEFSSLFEAAGFRLSGTSAVPAPAAYLSVIEGIPT